MVGIAVPLAFFLAVFAILYVYFTSRSKERLALIEKGTDASIFKLSPSESRLSLVKWGVFLIALSVGVITGFLLAAVIDEVVAFFTTILFFGGCGLIVAYFIVSKMGDEK